MAFLLRPVLDALNFQAGYEHVASFISAAQVLQSPSRDIQSERSNVKKWNTVPALYHCSANGEHQWDKDSIQSLIPIQLTKSQDVVMHIK